MPLESSLTIETVISFMKALLRITLLAVFGALTLVMQSCVYPPPYAYYQPRYGYHPRTYLDDDYYYSRPPRHQHRPRLDRDEEPSDQSYGPPSRTEKPAEKRMAEREEQRSSPPLSAEPPPAIKGEIPTATKTGNPNRVKSPYPPHTELDVSGLPSGSLAKDPTTGEKFRVP